MVSDTLEIVNAFIYLKIMFVCMRERERERERQRDRETETERQKKLYYIHCPP